MANCKNCGAAMQEGAEVCAACGATNEVKDANYLNGKDPTLLLVLAILLGAYGFPYWLIGETKKAVLRLVISVCTCGAAGIVFLVLNILDWLKMKDGEYVVDPNKLF